jgi:Protein of unknown function (DUF3108)
VSYRGFQRFGQVATGAFSIAVAAAAAAALSDPARAQGRLDAHYEASLAGIPVGKGNWAIEIADDQYSASTSGGTSGLMKAFSGGHGTGAAQGRVVNGLLVPSNYLATISSDNKQTETIRIQFAAGNVKEATIEPEPEPNPDRLPVTEAHRKGVIDPMTGSLIRVAGTADPIGPEACAASTSIFDGRMRYDLKLAFKRLENVKAKGYQGQVVVCALYFTPIAGYVPDRAAIKYLGAQRNMEVWLAPIAGTRVLVPFKVMVPTPVGMAALEATQFVATAVVKTTAKTQ